MSDPSRFARSVTAGLLARYDQPAPRYTSYPTAVEFHEGIDAADYEGRLAAANRRDDPLSIYLHLPFCSHRCLFCGCHVIITPHMERATPYLGLLKSEIGMVADRLPERRQFSQLHLGGGTPTYYSPAQLGEVLDHLLERFTPVEGAELAVEVDPRVTTTDHLDALADRGFNRVSMGVQDFTPEVQEAIERVQSVEQTERLIEHARSRGYRGINVDLIYGLPFQTPETFERTVEEVIRMGADRTAVYSFAFVPWMRAHMKKLLIDALPERETKFTLFGAAREKFLEAGYVSIGMDHFARPDDELALARKKGVLRRNFQGYTVLPADEVLGMGISAIGDISGAYVQNAKKLSDYGRLVEEGTLPVERGVARDADDDLRRELIHELMCNMVVDIPALEAKHGIEFTDYFAEDLALLRPHVDEGLAEVTDTEIRATETGELFVRNLALCFDRYWREKHKDSDKPTFSRSV